MGQQERASDGAVPDIRIRRVREPREVGETRILVDRLWPRGVSKEVADLDGWAKDATPSTALRKEFHGGEMTFESFTQAYRCELAAGEGLGELVAAVRTADGPVTFLIASDPSKQNHAEVLADVVREAIR